MTRPSGSLSRARSASDGEAMNSAPAAPTTVNARSRVRPPLGVSSTA
jgi:hypothetical protein